MEHEQRHWSNSIRRLGKSEVVKLMLLRDLIITWSSLMGIEDEQLWYTSGYGRVEMATTKWLLMQELRMMEGELLEENGRHTSKPVYTNFTGKLKFIQSFVHRWSLWLQRHWYILLWRLVWNNETSCIAIPSGRAAVQEKNECFNVIARTRWLHPRIAFNMDKVRMATFQPLTCVMPIGHPASIWAKLAWAMVCWKHWTSRLLRRQENEH